MKSATDENKDSLLSYLLQLSLSQAAVVAIMIVRAPYCQEI